MSAQTLNLSNLSSILSLSHTTLKEYLSLLQQLFLIDELPAYHNNHLKRLTKTPKLHLVDTGLACALMGLTSQTLERDRARLGHLVETWVFQELTKQASWLDAPLKLSHHRTKDQLEVDVVIESPRGVMAVEIKASASLTFSDFKGLAQLRTQLGDAWLGGMLLYDGERIVSSGEGLWAVPLSAL
jgi:predicted AAA+ superfamily ATPase